ncbi:MAG: hypothetical protein H7A36_01135 [Chlamydiales bacterium]|nr:hypothetical protein [Chlamydiales bacterium]
MAAAAASTTYYHQPCLFPGCESQDDVTFCALCRLHAFCKQHIETEHNCRKSVTHTGVGVPLALCLEKLTHLFSEKAVIVYFNESWRISQIEEQNQRKVSDNSLQITMAQMIMEYCQEDGRFCVLLTQHNAPDSCRQIVVLQKASEAPASPLSLPNPASPPQAAASGGSNNDREDYDIVEEVAKLVVYGEGKWTPGLCTVCNRAAETICPNCDFHLHQACDASHLTYCQTMGIQPGEGGAVEWSTIMPQAAAHIKDFYEGQTIISVVLGKNSLTIAYGLMSYADWKKSLPNEIAVQNLARRVEAILALSMDSKLLVCVTPENGENVAQCGARMLTFVKAKGWFW